MENVLKHTTTYMDHDKTNEILFSEQNKKIKIATTTMTMKQTFQKFNSHLDTTHIEIYV